MFSDLFPVVTVSLLFTSRYLLYWVPILHVGKFARGLGWLYPAEFDFAFPGPFKLHFSHDAIEQKFVYVFTCSTDLNGADDIMKFLNTTEYDSIKDFDELPDPIESGEEAIAHLEEAADLLRSVVKELKSLQGAEA